VDQLADIKTLPVHRCLVLSSSLPCQLLRAVFEVSGCWHLCSVSLHKLNGSRFHRSKFGT